MQQLIRQALGRRLARSNEPFKLALATFHEAAKRVPAYKDFLKKNHIDPSKIRTPEDFATVPPVTKENYLKQYPLKDLLWDGKTDDVRIISMSSGSSGQPFYWPRGNQAGADSAFFHELMFNQHFNTKEKETLVIIAFAMGTWIAGTYTLAAINDLANKGHRLVAVTPGIDKAAIIRILGELAPQFDQTIIMGYPPFVKDVLDGATEERIRLGPLNIKVVLAGESISERWRDYVMKKIKARDQYTFSSLIYGTADAGLLGNETPLAIYARGLAAKDPLLGEKIFPGAGRTLPTLVNYHPELRYFEEIEDNYLVFTVNNSLPLIRYQILDQGRLITHKELIEYLTDGGYKVPKALLPDRQLPLIALYTRSDIATTFYALDIYPENIKHGLEATQLQRFLTGKFVLRTEFDDQTQEQSLHLYAELKKSAKSDKALETKVLRSIIRSLKSQNSEYNRLSQELKHKADPIVHLLPYGSSEFEIKIKHRWVAR